MTVVTLNAERDRAIADALAECVMACNADMYKCNVEHESQSECARLCADCAAICDVIHALVSHGSRWAALMAPAAAQVSAACAAECEKFHDQFCGQCVKPCQAAAEACRELAARAGAG